MWLSAHVQVATSFDLCTRVPNCRPFWNQTSKKGIFWMSASLISNDHTMNTQICLAFMWHGVHLRWCFVTPDWGSAFISQCQDTTMKPIDIHAPSPNWFVVLLTSALGKVVVRFNNFSLENVSMVFFCHCCSRMPSPFCCHCLGFFIAASF